MTLRTHNRLMGWGFCLGYGAVMGSLVVADSPIIQGYRAWFLWTLLMLGVGGASLVAIGKLSRLEND